MSEGRPTKIAIDHDKYHAQHIGRTENGNQFFLTTPFEPAVGSLTGSEYVALYIFDESGRFLEGHIDDLGPRATMDRDAAKACYNRRLESLGKVEFCRIEVEPFSIEKGGTAFGLIPREPEEEGDVWAVELLPGNYMAFFEPWDSGEYDT